MNFGATVILLVKLIIELSFKIFNMSRLFTMLRKLSNRLTMKKIGYIGLAVTTLLFFGVVGLEIYIHGRPVTFDYCNGGDYLYSNWYYEFGDFSFSNVNWVEWFSSLALYIELLLFVPWFFYFGSKSSGRVHGLHRSKWLKSLLWMSVIPLIIVFLSLDVYSQRVVADYEIFRDPVCVIIVYTFALSVLVYYMNLLLWILVNGIRFIIRMLTNGVEGLFYTKQK